MAEFASQPFSQNTEKPRTACLYDRILGEAKVRNNRLARAKRLFFMSSGLSMSPCTNTPTDGESQVKSSHSTDTSSQLAAIVIYIKTAESLHTPHFVFLMRWAIFAPEFRQEDRFGCLQPLKNNAKTFRTASPKIRSCAGEQVKTSRLPTRAKSHSACFRHAKAGLFYFHLLIK